MTPHLPFFSPKTDLTKRRCGVTDKRPSAVREMFASIAPRYDFLNHLLSACIDRRWRAFTARKLREALPGPPPLVLDLCCGTGDLALELHSLSPSSSVVGCDFCHPMLVLGARKAHRARRILLVEGDALRLPFGDNLFDALTIGFGLRNLESLESGLREMRRVLRPDGVLAILEFSRPRPSLLRPLFQLYLVHLLPRLGDWLSGHRGPYSYLRDTIQEFPDAEGLQLLLQGSGFDGVEFFRLTGGVAVLHLARKI